MGNHDSAMQVTRDNLAQAIDEALARTQTAAAAFRANPGSPLTAHYIDLALSTLQDIKAQLSVPPSQRIPRPSRFDAAFVYDDPEFDESLASLIIKIEDVYRRWHREIYAR